MDITPINWHDNYLNTKERKILTFHEHGIPGLRMIGHHNNTRATAPLPIHYHKNCFEFTYIVQGNLTFYVNGENYPLSGGDLFITRPNEVHDTGNTPMSLHQMYWFQLDVSQTEHILYFDPTFAQWMIEQLDGLSTRVIKMDDSTEPLFKSIFSNLVSGTEVEQALAGTMIQVLLCQIIKNSKLQDFCITPDIAHTTDYILRHIHEKISMEELADIAALSVSRFKQKFKSQIGITPRNYINYHKIELAKKLLQDGVNVTNVAMDLGFSGSDYFSVVFRRYTSVAPTEYVKQANHINASK